MLVHVITEQYAVNCRGRRLQECTSSPLGQGQTGGAPQLQRTLKTAIQLLLKQKQGSGPEPAAAVCESQPLIRDRMDDGSSGERETEHDVTGAGDACSDGTLTCSTDYSDATSAVSSVSSVSAESIPRASVTWQPVTLVSGGGQCTPARTPEQAPPEGQRLEHARTGFIQAAILERRGLPTGMQPSHAPRSEVHGDEEGDRWHQCAGPQGEELDTPSPAQPVTQSITPHYTTAAQPAQGQPAGPTGRYHSVRFGRMMKNPEFVAAFKRAVNRTSAAPRAAGCGADGHGAEQQWDSVPLAAAGGHAASARCGGSAASWQGERLRSRADTLQGAALLSIPVALLPGAGVAGQGSSHAEGVAPFCLTPEVPVGRRLAPLSSPTAHAGPPLWLQGAHQTAPRSDDSPVRLAAAGDSRAAMLSRARAQLVPLATPGRAQPLDPERVNELTREIAIDYTRHRQPRYAEHCVVRDRQADESPGSLHDSHIESQGPHGSRRSVHWDAAAQDTCSGGVAPDEQLHSQACEPMDDRPSTAGSGLDSGSRLDMLGLLLRSRLRPRLQAARNSAALRSLRRLEDKVTVFGLSCADRIVHGARMCQRGNGVDINRTRNGVVRSCWHPAHAPALILLLLFHSC